MDDNDLIESGSDASGGVAAPEDVLPEILLNEENAAQHQGNAAVHDMDDIEIEEDDGYEDSSDEEPEPLNDDDLNGYYEIADDEELVGADHDDSDESSEEEQNEPRQQFARNFFRRMLRGLGRRLAPRQQQNVSESEINFDRSLPAEHAVSASGALVLGTLSRNVEVTEANALRPVIKLLLDIVEPKLKESAKMNFEQL